MMKPSRMGNTIANKTNNRIKKICFEYFLFVILMKYKVLVICFFNEKNQESIYFSCGIKYFLELLPCNVSATKTTFPN